MNLDLEAYLRAHSEQEPSYLARIKRETFVQVLNPSMISDHIQGRFLKMICQMVAPKHVLELGTFTGYSALCLAEGLTHDAHLDTIEIDDELEELIRTNFATSPYNSQITLHIGDALEIIPMFIEESFDLVFIDADKRFYLDYYEAILPMVKPGGFILVDNTLWHGKVLEEHIAPTDRQSIGILAFNEFLVTDRRVEQFILPLRDGLTMIYKK